MYINTVFSIFTEYIRLFFHPKYRVKIINVLFSAIYDYNLDMIEFLLRNKVDPNKEMVLVDPMDYNRTPLVVSASLGHTEIVKILLKYGADIDGRISVWFTSALHTAVQYNKYEIACLLLENGADVNIQDYELMTPMHTTLLCNPFNEKMVRLLLKYGADVRLKNNMGDSAMDIACKNYISDEIKDIFKSLYF
ncbi:ankyrin repeat protein [Penguinpox virus]|uniref:Ankyrin repeat protein n=1 Tax=Penguinpox virus TaxID=648998 RepID=A0A068EFL7_9POXV|nr:ankyrin repeat protein [Penguinpox virus]AID46976.1 ankyrin repeat protein [Penguinpox virus]